MNTFEMSDIIRAATDPQTEIDPKPLRLLTPADALRLITLATCHWAEKQLAVSMLSELPEHHSRTVACGWRWWCAIDSICERIGWAEIRRPAVAHARATVEAVVAQILTGTTIRNAA